jgi:Zn-dependent M28 family amino/carboxypeptidase
MKTKKSRLIRSLGLLLVLVVSLAMLVPTALADDITETKGFRKAVTLAGIRQHQAALQTIANANNGTRLAGTPGYDQSVDYVVDKLTAAGYSPTVQPFEFLLVSDRTPPTFERVSPNPATFVDGVDFGTIQYSGSGDVTGQLFAVDLVVPPGEAANSNTSGCEAADFAGFAAGSIALLQRGTCTFRVKADNALAAGAIAVVIFNEGQPGRIAGAFGTLGPPLHPLPVLSASFALGDALRNGVLNGSTGVTVHIRTDTVAEMRTAYNVLAETASGDPNRVIVVGGHLDSVSRGPGINDNGSGSATILEIAEIFAAQGRVARNKIRFAWWGAEEEGLLGSTYYVENLSQAERDQIELNLNFDMIGSPNYVRFVYDGDNSAFPVGPNAAAGPPGSGTIEQLFHQYFASQGLASAETPFSGRSDYGPFIAVGIPAGGLFTGAEGAKTEDEAAIYGGIVGEQYDPCYHLACDTYAGTGSGTGSTSPGLGLKALDEMSDAVAHAVLRFSKHNFDQNPLVSPAARAARTLARSSAAAHDHHGAVDR